MKKLLALLMILCLLPCAALADEVSPEEPAADAGAQTAEAAAEEETAGIVLDITDESAFTPLENGWILTAKDVLKITDASMWLADRDSIAYLDIMLLMDALVTEDFELNMEQYSPYNAYVGFTQDNRLVALYPGKDTPNTLVITHNFETGNSFGKYLEVDTPLSEDELTYIMSSLCGINVNKADPQTVAAIMQAFIDASAGEAE